MIATGYIPGAIGRVAQLHGEYYAARWGFGAYFEGKVARELADFVERYDASRDCLWLAIDDGRIDGSIAIQAADYGARLRWFIASDALRGTGAGNQLVAHAVSFCRQSLVPIVDLWTFRGLDAARHLYEKHGFRLVEERDGTQWGVTVTEQKFELRLPR